MTPCDKLASLGFPITEPVASVLGVPPLPLLDVSRADSTVGNAMQLSNCILIMMLALTCFGPVDSSAQSDFVCCWPGQWNKDYSHSL